MPEIGQTVSHYRIIEKLSQPRMGEVFLAHYDPLDRKVAQPSFESQLDMGYLIGHLFNQIMQLRFSSNSPVPLYNRFPGERP